MMRTDNFRIVFKYEDKKVTNCKILDNDDNIVGEGQAVKSESDHFCREIGRRYSLKRAVTTLPKEARIEIWSKYQTATKVPRW